MTSSSRSNNLLLDPACLRSFVAIAQLGSISAAASLVHLSQSALSLQIQRLEDQLGHALLIRHARGVRLTEVGENLLPHARAILDANRLAVSEVLSTTIARPIRLGTPHDMLHPNIPAVVRRFSASHPNRDIRMEMAASKDLHARMACGEMDIIVTTDFDTAAGAQTIGRRRFGWVGARGSHLAAARPLPIALTRGCVFAAQATAALEHAGIGFVLAVDSPDTRAVEAAVAADKGIYATMIESLPAHLEELGSAAGLPQLPDVRINLHVAPISDSLVAALGAALEDAFAEAPPATA